MISAKLRQTNNSYENIEFYGNREVCDKLMEVLDFCLDAQGKINLQGVEVFNDAHKRKDEEIKAINEQIGIIKSSNCPLLFHPKAFKSVLKLKSKIEKINYQKSLFDKRIEEIKNIGVSGKDLNETVKLTLLGNLGFNIMSSILSVGGINQDIVRETDIFQYTGDDEKLSENICRLTDAINDFIQIAGNENKKTHMEKIKEIEEENE